MRILYPNKIASKENKFLFQKQQFSAAAQDSSPN